MRILGIDLGSRAVKIVILHDKEIESNVIIDTPVFYREYCQNVDGKICLNRDLLSFGDIDKIVSTGYGRNNINIKGAKVITELKAHTIGAVWQTKLADFTLVDVGGQDSKVISVANEKMVDMVLNDKCAASCGRYLENMANVLGISTIEMSAYFEDPVELNSTCAVFSESELIGSMSEGTTIEKLSAGVNYSLFKRIRPLLDRFPAETLLVSGGVAQNQAFINFIKRDLDFPNVIVPVRPQINGAIGCCVFGFNNID